MPTTTMTIAYINPPKPGKQRGSIKGTDGRFLGCFADKFHLFEIGQTYDVEYNEIPMNGTVLKTVKSATLIEPDLQLMPPPTPPFSFPGFGERRGGGSKHGRCAIRPAIRRRRLQYLPRDLPEGRRTHVRVLDPQRLHPGREGSS